MKNVPNRVYSINIAHNDAIVITIINNKLFGGDSNFYYNGTIELKDDESVVGELKFVNYSDSNLTMFSTFENEYMLTFEGDFNEKNYDITNVVMYKNDERLPVEVKSLCKLYSV